MLLNGKASPGQEVSVDRHAPGSPARVDGQADGDVGTGGVAAHRLVRRHVVLLQELHRRAAAVGLVQEADTEEGWGGRVPAPTQKGLGGAYVLGLRV